jgi:uncharacterized protein YycO
MDIRPNDGAGRPGDLLVAESPASEAAMIRINLTASSGVLGRIILWMTRGIVNHAMIVYESSIWGGHWAAQAVGHGVEVVPLFRALRGRKSIAVYRCKFDAEVALKKIRRKVGAPYDFKSMLWFGWAIVAWRIFKRKIKKPWKNTRGQFCSELVARMFHAAGLPDTDWDFELVSPEDLRLYCEAHPELFEKEALDEFRALAA